jgi:hypothetical protein
MTNGSNFCGPGDITKLYVVGGGGSGGDIYVTGGTYSEGTLILGRNDGINIPISGFFTGLTVTDIFVTGGTYSNGTLILERNDGITIPISGFLTGTTDVFVTGGTYSNGTLSLERNDGVTILISGFSFTGNTSADCITDLYVSNLNSCSPLHIQNISSGDVLIVENGNGNVGINNPNPTSTLDIIGGFTVSGTSNLNGVLNVIGSTSPQYVTFFKGVNGTGANFAIGVGDDNFGVANDVLNSVFTGYDKYNLTASEINFNIIGDNNVPQALFINRNGDTTVSSNLNVSGITQTTNLQVRNGATNNYILRSDVLGNASWSPDGSVTAFTFNKTNYDLTLSTNKGVSFIENLGILVGDLTIVSGTYDPITGTATFTNNSGGTFSVTGFLTGYTDTRVTGYTYDGQNTFTIQETDGLPHSATINNLVGLGNLQSNSITGTTDIYTSAIHGLSPLHIQPVGNVNTNHVYLRENGGSVGIGTTIIDSLAPEALVVSGRTLSYNIMNAKANVNNYAQINVVNKSSGTSASSDVVATNDTGTELINYIDMGINGSNFSGGLIGTANDAYLYSTGRELYIGNATTGVNGNIKFFAGDAALNVDMIISGSTGFVGVGTLTPTERLDVNGKTKTTNFQMTNGAINNYVLTSDSNGNAYWAPAFSGITFDNYITGGTYSNGTLTLNRQNGSVIINGLSTGYTLTSSAINTALGYTPLSAYTDTFVTGGTYSNGTITLNRQNGIVSITGLSTGYTLTSSAINTVLGYTPLSAYTDTFVTGGTYSNGTLTLNRQNGSVSISGIKFTGNTLGDCITDLYISNIHSCSPLRINPLDEGNVYFGSTSGVTIDVLNKRVGINTPTPQYSFESLSTSAVDSIMYFDGGTLANSNIVSASDTSVKVPSLVLWDRGTGPYSGTGTSMYIGLDRATSSQHASRNDVIYVNNFLNKGHYFVTNNSGVKSVKMNILSNGNVGVGVNSPTVKLHLSGDSIFEQSKLTINQKTGVVGIDIVNSTEAMYQLTRNVNDWALVGKSDTGFYFYSNDKKPITFWTDGTEKMRVTSGGTFGVGTKDPTATIHTKGIDSSSSNYGLKVQNSGTTNNLTVRNDGLVEGDGFAGNSFQLGSYNPLIEGSGITVGRLERDYNTIFSIYGANYPSLYFDSSYSTKVALTSGAGGQHLELSDNVNPKFTLLSSTRIGINIPNTATTTINTVLDVNGNTLVKGGLTASTVNISTTPATDTSTAAYYLTRDSVTGDVKQKLIPGPTAYGLFAQTGNSTIVSATTTETSLINGGVGTLSVPANGFQIGDSFRVDFGGVISNKNGETLTLKIIALTGGTNNSIVLAQATSPSLASATNEVFQLTLNFTIRKLGGPGVASIVSLGVFHNVKTANGALEGFAFNNVNNTTFDTTVATKLDITAQWGSVSTSNSIYSDIFVLNKIY